MNNLVFNYLIYIRSTPEAVWDAFINPNVSKQYWQHSNISNWKKGAQWQYVALDGTIKLTGEILEITSDKLLVLSWTDAADTAETSCVAIDLTQAKEAVCLKITHCNFRSNSKMFADIKIGWPMVLSSMKSFLETGQPLIVWNN